MRTGQRHEGSFVSFTVDADLRFDESCQQLHPRFDCILKLLERNRVVAQRLLKGLLSGLFRRSSLYDAAELGQEGRGLAARSGGRLERRVLHLGADEDARPAARLLAGLLDRGVLAVAAAARGGGDDGEALAGEGRRCLCGQQGDRREGERGDRRFLLGGGG